MLGTREKGVHWRNKTNVFLCTPINSLLINIVDGCRALLTDTKAGIRAVALSQEDNGSLPSLRKWAVVVKP